MTRKVADYIDGCFVEIYDRAIKDEEASEKEGHPVFKPTPYVKIKATNSRDVFDQPLNSEKKRRYSELFAKFESGEEVVMSGWPIAEWGYLDATQVETLKSAGILTVEALAEMPESGMHRLPSGYITLKQRAGEALSQRNSSEQVRMEFETFAAEHEAKMATMNETIAGLAEDVADLSKIVERLAAPEKAKKTKTKETEPA